MNKTLMKSILYLLLLISAVSSAFEYDSAKLPDNLKSATDIVIAKKISGNLALGHITNEIDSYSKKKIDWRSNKAWEKLQEHNKINSSFLVLNSIRGKFEVSDIFQINDSWIPIDLGSVVLMFLNREEKYIEANPCHILNLEQNKEEIIELSDNPEELISYILSNELSFCSREIKFET